MMDDQSGDAALPDSPFQPRNLAFPSREFGKASVEHRSFQPKWFDRQVTFNKIIFPCINSLSTS